MTYSHSVGWADDPTCPDCHATDHTVVHIFSRPTYPTEDMWTAPTHPGSPIPTGSSSILRPTHLTRWLWLPPPLTFIPAEALSPRGERVHFIFHPLSLFFHFIYGPGVNPLPAPPLYNNNLWSNPPAPPSYGYCHIIYTSG